MYTYRDCNPRFRKFPVTSGDPGIEGRIVVLVYNPKSTEVTFSFRGRDPIICTVITVGTVVHRRVSSRIGTGILRLPVEMSRR